MPDEKTLEILKWVGIGFGILIVVALMLTAYLLLMKETSKHGQQVIEDQRKKDKYWKENHPDENFCSKCW